MGRHSKKYELHLGSRSELSPDANDRAAWYTEGF